MRAFRAFRLARGILAVALALAGAAALPGCKSAGESESEKAARAKADALAQAFWAYVDCYYGTRLAEEVHEKGPSPATRLRVREDLARALREVGSDLPDASDDAAALKAAVEAVRENLVQHDYVFLPLGRSGGADEEDPGIALGHVRERDPARSMELWGRTIEYKRVIYEPFIRDYASWRALALHLQGPIYSPGQFSGSTIYIDHEQLAKRAALNAPPYDKLGLEGLTREVELRAAAYLLFTRDVPRSATLDPLVRGNAIVRVHERVLWTVVRYGDPDVALADLKELASGSARTDMREAAEHVLAAIPAGTADLRSKSKRADVLHSVAEEVWPRISAD